MFKKLALGLVLCLAPLHAEDYSLGVIGPYSGLNNTDSSFIIGPDKSPDLLNVDITPNGKSVKKRSGYGTAFTLDVSSVAVHGVYNFFESGGSDVSLFFNDKYMSSSVSGGSPSVIFSTGPTDATYQCTDAAGFAYCANTSRTSIIKTNGVTHNIIITPSTGTMVAVTPTRLVTAGFSDFPSRVDFSKSNDFTNFTPGGAATDPLNFTIVSPGSKITMIVYAHGRIYWFKDSSFGYILEGPTQADWQVRTVNSFIGSLYNTFIFRDDILYFQGNDGHFYGWDGSNLVKLSRDIQGTIDVTQGRSLNSWTQTLKADWDAGAISTATYLATDISVGSIVLATDTAISAFSDTTGINFSSGTLTNTSTSTIDGSLTLTLGNNNVFTDQQRSPIDVECSDPCTGPYYQESRILSTNTFVATGATLNLKKVGSPSAFNIFLYSDNSGNPGSVLTSASPSASLVATSTSDVFLPFDSSVVLTNGTSYWIQITPGVTCDGSNKIEWWGADFVGTPTTINRCGSDDSVNIRYQAKLVGKQFASSGDIVSRSFDVGFTTNSWLWDWSNFSASGTIPSGATLTFETQTSSAATGTYTSLISVSTGNNPTSTIQQYIRYKGSFTTTNLSTSPVVNDVVLAMSTRRRPYGTFQSAVKNAPSLTSWSDLFVSKQDNGGTHTFYIRAANGAFTVSSSTPTPWTAITPGSIPSISTGSYFQIRDDFLITSATQNPSLDLFTQSWFEGAAADKTYAIYHDNGLWWSVASGTGASTNNAILKFDLLNTAWLKYDIPMNGMLVRNQNLYFGSPSSGKIYLYGSASSDSGSAINAYWKSKDFFGESPFLEKEIVNLSFAAGSVANSSMTVTYTMNGSSQTSYTVNLYDSNKSFIRNNKNLPQGKIGNTFNVKFGNNAADQDFEIYAVQYGYRQKSWIPSP